MRLNGGLLCLTCCALCQILLYCPRADVSRRSHGTNQCNQQSNRLIVRRRDRIASAQLGYRNLFAPSVSAHDPSMVAILCRLHPRPHKSDARDHLYLGPIGRQNRRRDRSQDSRHPPSALPFAPYQSYSFTSVQLQGAWKACPRASRERVRLAPRPGQVDESRSRHIWDTADCESHILAERGAGGQV